MKNSSRSKGISLKMRLFFLAIFIFIQSTTAESGQHENGHDHHGHNHHQGKDKTSHKHHTYAILYKGEESEHNILDCKPAGQESLSGQGRAETAEATEEQRREVKKSWAAPNGVRIFLSEKRVRGDFKGVAGDDDEGSRGNHGSHSRADSKSEKKHHRHRTDDDDNDVPVTQDPSQGPAKEAEPSKDKHSHHDGGGRSRKGLRAGANRLGKHHHMHGKSPGKPWVELTDQDQLVFHNPDESVEGVYVCSYQHGKDRQSIAQTVITVHVFSKSTLDIGARLKLATLATLIFIALVGLGYGGYACYRKSRPPQYFMARSYDDPIDIPSVSEVFRREKSDQGEV